MKRYIASFLILLFLTNTTSASVFTLTDSEALFENGQKYLFQCEDYKTSKNDLSLSNIPFQTLASLISDDADKELFFQAYEKDKSCIKIIKFNEELKKTQNEDRKKMILQQIFDEEKRIQEFQNRISTIKSLLEELRLLREMIQKRMKTFEEDFFKAVIDIYALVRDEREEISLRLKNDSSLFFPETEIFIEESEEFLPNAITPASMRSARENIETHLQNEYNDIINEYQTLENNAHAQFTHTMETHLQEARNNFIKSVNEKWTGSQERLERMAVYDEVMKEKKELYEDYLRMTENHIFQKIAPVIEILENNGLSSPFPPSVSFSPQKTLIASSLSAQEISEILLIPGQEYPQEFYVFADTLISQSSDTLEKLLVLLSSPLFRLRDILNSALDTQSVLQNKEEGNFSAIQTLLEEYGQKTAQTLSEEYFLRVKNTPESLSLEMLSNASDSGESIPFSFHEPVSSSQGEKNPSSPLGPLSLEQSLQNMIEDSSLLFQNFLQQQPLSYKQELFKILSHIQKFLNENTKFTELDSEYKNMVFFVLSQEIQNSPLSLEHFTNILQEKIEEEHLYFTKVEQEKEKLLEKLKNELQKNTGHKFASLLGISQISFRFEDLSERVQATLTAFAKRAVRGDALLDSPLLPVSRFMKKSGETYDFVLSPEKRVIFTQEKDFPHTVRSAVFYDTQYRPTVEIEAGIATFYRYDSLSRITEKTFVHAESAYNEVRESFLLPLSWKTPHKNDSERFAILHNISYSYRGNSHQVASEKISSPAFSVTKHSYTKITDFYYLADELSDITASFSPQKQKFINETKLNLQKNASLFPLYQTLLTKSITKRGNNEHITHHFYYNDLFFLEYIEEIPSLQEDNTPQSFLPISNETEEEKFILKKYIQEKYQDTQVQFVYAFQLFSQNTDQLFHSLSPRYMIDSDGRIAQTRLPQSSKSISMFFDSAKNPLQEQTQGNMVSQAFQLASENEFMKGATEEFLLYGISAVGFTSAKSIFDIFVKKHGVKILGKNIIKKASLYVSVPLTAYSVYVLANEYPERVKECALFKNHEECGRLAVNTSALALGVPLLIKNLSLSKLSQPFKLLLKDLVSQEQAHILYDGTILVKSIPKTNMLLNITTHIQNGKTLFIKQPKEGLHPIFSFLSKKSLETQQKALQKLGNSGVSVLESPSSHNGFKLVLESAGEIAEDAFKKNPQLKNSFQKFSEEASKKLWGVHKFYNDINPRNVGYINGEFKVFDPIVFDSSNTALASSWFLGVVSATLCYTNSCIESLK